MDAEELISAICAKIDEYQRRMEAIFDKSLQKIATNSSSSPTQISSSKSEEKGVLALENVPRPGDGKERASNQQLRECHLQIGRQEVLVESVQENPGNTVKMAKIFTAQESELESLANSREHDHGVLEAPPTKLNWEINSEARNLSFSNKFEFGGNNTALILELPTFGDCIWARQCEKHYRICGIIDAHDVFVEMPIRRFIGSAYSNQVCKAQLHLGNCVFDPGIAEDLHYSSDCFSKQVVEQASLKWEGCGLILILASHCNGSKLIRSCEYGSRIVDRRVGDVISVFDPGIVCNDRISKFLSTLATTWVVFGCTGDVTIVIAPSLPYDRGKEAPLSCSQMVVVDSYMFMVSLFAIEVLDVYLVGSERLKVDSNAKMVDVFASSISDVVDGEPIMVTFDKGKSHTLDSYFGWEMQDYVLVFNPGIAAWWNCCSSIFPCSSLKLLKWLLGFKPWMLQSLLACYVSFSIVRRTIWIIAWLFGCQLQVLVLVVAEDCIKLLEYPLKLVSGLFGFNLQFVASLVSPSLYKWEFEGVTQWNSSEKATRKASCISFSFFLNFQILYSIHYIPCIKCVFLNFISLEVKAL